jgi:membrane-associated protein
MEHLPNLVDLVLHLDRHLSLLLAQYGSWVYAILFLIIFLETGLVVTPFLPGDSLLFVAGALAATGGMHVGLLIAVLWIAAVAGDNCNYWIGRQVGARVFRWEQSRLFNRKAFDRTHAFYEKHGGVTLIVARFMPVVRTFAPFVAGVGAMTYRRFFLYDLAGGTIWIVSLTLAGYWFGNLPWVKENLSLVIVLIILASFSPMIVHALRRWGRGRRTAAEEAPPAAYAGGRADSRAVVVGE